ncbi:hypothetical protein MPER_13828, partial [Moniliophthora perniciosa FA553]
QGLEPRTAKIADPAVDLKTKHAFACEIREMLDTTRDSESTQRKALIDHV